MPETLNELGTILMVSSKRLSAVILKDFIRRLELAGLATGNCARLLRQDKVSKIRQDILHKHFNSSRFSSKS